MNKSVLCLLILIIGLALCMGAACASENFNTPASVGESPMEVENGEALSSNEGNALEESSSGSEEKSSNDPLDSKLSAPQNNPSLTANEEGNFTELQELIDSSYDGTLVLDKNYYFNQGFDITGISITDSITIDGNNKVLDGKKLGRIFYINATSVILKNINFINGYVGFEYYDIYDGGAIFCGGGDVLLENCTFIGNSATGNGGAVYWAGYGVLSDSIFINNSATGDGGAVFWRGGGNLNSSNFTDNTARYGDDVYWDGFGNLTYSTFINNHECSVYWNGIGSLSDCTFVNCSSYMNGGAVYWNGTDGVLKNTIFVNCSAGLFGGAVYWAGANGSIIKSSFKNCSNNDRYGGIVHYGGAVYWTGVNGSISKSNFTDCSAPSGGAVYWTGPLGIVDECIFKNCSSQYAGAIYLTGDNGTLRNSSFADCSLCAVYWNSDYGVMDSCNFINISARNGGAVYWTGNYGNLTNSYFTDCSAGRDGGAIHWRGISGSVDKCRFENCYSMYGGAVYWYGAYGNFTNTNFLNCTTNVRKTSAQTYDGGAVYWFGAYSFMQNCSFVNCSSNRDGGAVYWVGAYSTMDNCSFINCTTNLDSASGGAIYWRNINGTLSNSKFENCSSKNSAVVYWYGIYGNLENCSFLNCSSIYGGAVCLMSNYGNLNNCSFVSCSAIYGGAVYLGGMMDTVSQSSFIDCSAGHGGAVYCQGNNVSLSDSVFMHCSASYHGGAVYWQGINGHLNGSSFNNNSADENGGAVYWDGINGHLNGSSFNNNSADENGGAVCWNGDNGRLSGSSFNNNSVDYYGSNRTLGRGGAVYWAVPYGNLTGSTFTSNSAIMGGAVYMREFGPVLNCNFTNNDARLNGGAIYYNGPSSSVLDGGLNNALPDDYLASTWFATLLYCNFNNNFAANIGSAVFFTTNAKVSNCNFDNNSAFSAVLYYDGNVKGSVSDCNFTNNVASSNYGAISVDSATVSNCNFINNRAKGSSGAIRLGSGSVLNCNFTNNVASLYDAGAISIVQGTVSNCSFINNSAVGFGGAIRFYNQANVFNCSFINNSAGRYGGAIHMTSNPGYISNCNFTNNNDSDGFDVFIAGNAIVTIADSSFYKKEEYGSIFLYEGELYLVRNYIYSNVLNKNRGTLYLDANVIDGFIINEGSIATLTNATFLDNKTVPAEFGDTVRVYGTLVDDNGNSIIDERFDITVNGAAVENVKFDKNQRLYVAPYIVNTHGDNLVSTSYDATVVNTGIFDVPKANITEFSIVVGGKSNIIPYGENADVFVTLLGINDVGLNETLAVVVNNKPYTVAVKNGKGSFNVSGLAPGQYAAWSMFSGNGQYNSAYATGLFSVLEPETRLIVNVDDTVVGEELLIKINLTDSRGNPIMGMVNLTGDLFETSVAVNGYLEIPVSGVLAGNYTVTASFAGDDTYESADNATTFEVKKVSDYLFLATAGTGFDFGETVYVSVTLPDDATGTVNITINGITYDAVVENGEATIEIPDLASGDYPLWEVFYSGNEKYVLGVTNTDIYVFPASPELEVYFDKDTINYGEYAVLFIDINADATGTIAVYNIDDSENPRLIANITVQEALEEGVVINDLNAGLHFFEIRYSGDENFVDGIRRDFITVEKAFVNWTVDDVPGEIDVGDSIDIVLDLVDPSDAPGKLNITVDGKQIGVYTFDEIKDGISLDVFNKSGSYTVVISALDDPNYDYAGPFEFNVVVRTIDAGMEIDLPDDVEVGDVVVVSVTLPGDATGNVTVSVDGKKISPVELVEGKVNIPLEGLAAGNHTISVTYSGDDKYSPDVCEEMDLTVNKVVSTISVEAEYIRSDDIVVVTVSVADDATGIVLVDLGVAKSYGIIKDGKAVINVSGLPEGNFTVNAVYPGDFKYGETNGSDSVEVVKERYDIRVTMIDGLKLTAVLTDENGKPVSNTLVSYKLDNGEAVNVTTDSNGEFVCDVESNCVLTMTYAKADKVLCDASIIIKNINPNRKKTWIDVPANMEFPAAEFKKGEPGSIFYFYLRDSNGNGIANKGIKVGIFDKQYTVKTDANGRAELPIRIANSSYYTYAPVFLGDKDYEASSGVCSLHIVKKSTTITPAKTSYTFSASAKTKTVTATLKSTNSFIPNGKQVTLTIAGKTFKTTIGDKGQINFNIGSITLKGTYKVQIKFAGTNTYAASNSQTITIKIA